MAATITMKALKHVLLDIENYILSLRITQMKLGYDTLYRISST